MAARKSVKTAVKSVAKDSLIADLKKQMKGLPVTVIGRIDAPSLCCNAGTVAIVKIDRGDPAPFRKKATATKKASRRK